MIVVRHRHVNRFPKNILWFPFPLSSSLSMSATSSASPSFPPSKSPQGSTVSCTGGGQNFDWHQLFSSENKLRTIQLLAYDRDNVGSTFSMLHNDYKKAAVLIPLCYDTAGRPALLYNLRSSNLSTHRSQISFPGGTMDPEDKDDPIAAALRETQEELGIPSDIIEIWTTLRVFPTIATNLGVIPVLGFISNGAVDAKQLHINPSEVDHAFTVSLEHLCDPKNYDFEERERMGAKYTMPIWKNLNCFIGSEEVILWGLTAFVTHLALTALVPAEHYSRKIPYLKLKKSKRSVDGGSETEDSKL